MTAKQRIMTLKLIEKIEKNEKYSKKLGIEINKVNLMIKHKNRKEA